MRKSLSVRCIVIGLVACLIAGSFASCRAPDPQAECESNLHLSLKHYIGRPLPSLRQFEEEVAVRYDATVFGYTPPLDPNSEVLPSSVEVHWRPANSRRRYGLLAKEGQITSTWVTYESNHRPTLRDVTTCLGPPLDYWAWYGETYRGTGWATDVLLLYPVQGVVASGFDQSRHREIESGGIEDRSFLAEIHVSTIGYSGAMSSEELVRRAYSFAEFGTREALVHWYINNIKPWPGSWDEVTVMTLPRP